MSNETSVSGDHILQRAHRPLVSAKNKYQGPVSTLEEDVVTRD